MRFFEKCWHAFALIWTCAFIRDTRVFFCIFPGGRKVFRSFLRCEYSEENILFWLACEDLKKERSPEMIEEKARIIYEDYVSILSPREVSRLSILRGHP